MIMSHLNSLMRSRLRGGGGCHVSHRNGLMSQMNEELYCLLGGAVLKIV